MKIFDAMTDEDMKSTKNPDQPLIRDIEYEELEEINKKLKKRVQEAEGEVEKLKADLARAKEDHQYDNLIHQKELEDFRKGRWDPNFKPLDGSER